MRNAFERRLSASLSEVQQTSGLLLKRDYQIAFIGSIGIGKSTAICRLTGLEIPDDKGGSAAPVLEAGAGGITISEVHLRAGPEYGLLVEPRCARFATWLGRRCDARRVQTDSWTLCTYLP